MSTNTLFFSGKTKWCKVRKPDEKYDTYQVPLYLDEKQLNLYKNSGIQLKIREDEDGTFVVFKRRHVEFNAFTKEQVTNGPPEVTIKKGKEYLPYPDGLIGNGSELTVKVQVYDTPRRGPGTKGHRLLAVGIDKLVEYKPESVDDQMPF